MASIWKNMAGTLSGFIRLGLTGVRLKNSAGSLSVRNAGDSADAVVLPQSLGTGTRDGTKYLRDDGAWSSLPIAKNLIIGGNFSTNPWQRGTSIALAATGAYYADRFRINYNTTAVATIAKTADAPTLAQAGFYTQHCFHIDITTADASIGSAEAFTLLQTVEGFVSAPIGFGQTGTRFVTLSFWHKHTKTGVNCVAIRNSANDRSYVAEYTQTTTNTWQKSVITIPVDTTGTWLHDENAGLNLSFSLAAGTTFHTTANTWATGSFTATSSQVNNLDSTANDFKIALIQLEFGANATEFEYEMVSTVLAKCQRYYEITGGTNMFSGNVTSGSTYYHTLFFKATKRVAPTHVLTYVNASNFPASAPSVIGGGPTATLVGLAANATGPAFFQYNATLNADY